MQAGTRRALGATMAAGVLAGGMALGAGTASANVCTDVDGTAHQVLPAFVLESGACLETGPALAAAEKVYDDANEATTDTPPVAPPTTTTTSSPTDPTPGGGKTDTPPPGEEPITPANGVPGLQPVPAGSTTNGGTAQAPVAVAAGAPGVAALGAQPAGVLPTDLTGTPFEPSLMAAAGIYDPALLLGPGAPTASLQTVGGNPASAVTSASQIQAMALNAPASLGIGATVGVVILAGLGGLVLRHRLMRRVKKAATS